MSDLESFLRARGNEDLLRIDWMIDSYGMGDDSGELVERFLRRFSVPRLRAEAKSRLQLLNWYANADDRSSRGESPPAHGLVTPLVLAAWGYSDHPEYDEQWSIL